MAKPIPFQTRKQQIESIMKGFEVISHIDEWKGNKTKLKVKCPNNHIWGTATVDSLLNQKNGCPICYNEQRKRPIVEIAKIGNNIHNNEYEYISVDYNDGRSYIKLLHKNCNTIFTKTVDDHLSGSGCMTCCIKSQTKSTNQFIQDAKRIHGDAYDYELTIYKNKRTKLKIKHVSCGNIFEQTATTHLKGSGCPNCVKTNFQDSKDGWLYVCILYNPITLKEFVGYGKTNHPKNRLMQHKKSAERLGYLIRDWYCAKMNSGKEASKIESVIDKHFVHDKNIKVKGFLYENASIDKYQEIKEILIKSSCSFSPAYQFSYLSTEPDQRTLVRLRQTPYVE